MTNFHGVTFDTDLIPNLIERKQKETLELYRRICCLYECVLHMRRKPGPDKIRAFYNLQADTMMKEIEEMMADAHTRYSQMIEAKNGVQNK